MNYHTAEQLKMVDDNKAVLTDMYSQRRYHTRNIYGDNSMTGQMDMVFSPLNEFNTVEKLFQNYFWAGVISFIITYLFIYEPAIIYNKGQRLLGIVFNFFKPLVRVAPYLLPIYTIAIFIAYLIFSSALKTKESVGYFIFLFSFSLTLHLIFSAKSVRSKQGDFLKANYIFGFSFVYILDLTLLAFCLNIIFKEFSFVSFFNNSFQIGKNIVYAIFKQLFL